MTYKQNSIYKKLKNNVHLTDLMNIENTANMENLMNIVMQLRKVCNHPELFQLQDAKVPFLWTDNLFASEEQAINPLIQAMLYVSTYGANPIVHTVSKLVYDEILNMSRSSIPSWYYTNDKFMVLK